LDKIITRVVSVYIVLCKILKKKIHVYMVHSIG